MEILGTNHVLMYNKDSATPVQIEEEIEQNMSLFCETCNNRRLPKWIKEENKTQWLCETCCNYVDDKNSIIRQSIKEF